MSNTLTDLLTKLLPLSNHNFNEPIHINININNYPTLQPTENVKYQKQRNINIKQRIIQVCNKDDFKKLNFTRAKLLCFKLNNLKISETYLNNWNKLFRTYILPNFTVEEREHHTIPFINIDKNRFINRVIHACEIKQMPLSITVELVNNKLYKYCQ